MKRREFEQLAKDARLKPLERINLRGKHICLAEGARRPDDEMDVPYWHVAYAIGLDEDMDTCQRIKIPQYINMPSGIQVRVDPQTRKEVVMDAAMEWIETNEEVGRF